MAYKTKKAAFLSCILSYVYKLLEDAGIRELTILKYEVEGLIILNQYLIMQKMVAYLLTLRELPSNSLCIYYGKRSLVKYKIVGDKNE